MSSGDEKSGMAEREPGIHSSGATHLRAAFAIEPHSGANCAVVEADAHGEAITQDLVCWDGDSDCNGDDGCECRSEVTGPDSGEQLYIESEVTDRCICPVFRSHDCIASIDGFDDGTLEVSITTPTRAELVDIVTALRATGASVRLRSITGADSPVDRSSLALEVGELTDKQREAVRVAVAEGYYETPRRTDLETLAADLGVSRSAVSQRLTAVESKLVTALFERI